MIAGTIAAAALGVSAGFATCGHDGGDIPNEVTADTTQEDLDDPEYQQALQTVREERARQQQWDEMHPKQGPNVKKSPK